MQVVQKFPAKTTFSFIRKADGISFDVLDADQKLISLELERGFTLPDGVVVGSKLTFNEEGVLQDQQNPEFKKAKPTKRNGCVETRVQG